MPGETDRRRWRRLRSELPLQLELLESGHSFTAMGSHLNPAGIFVRVADPPAMGERVRVTLSAEGTHGLLTSIGEVVDRVAPNDAEGRPPGVGVQLEQVGPAWQKLYDHLSADD